MAFITPLKRVTGLGSAKEGTDHFWRQRLTAIANVPLFVFFIYFILSHIGASRAEIIEALSNPVTASIVGLMIISGALHMKLGMQVVIEDYVHNEGTKIISLLLNTFFSIAMAVIAIVSLLQISFS